MALYIKEIQCSASRYCQYRNLDDLHTTHQLTERDIKAYQRIFSLQSVVMNSLPHKAMHLETLQALVDKYLDLRATSGVLIYSKTQTHNTLFDDDWLGDIARACGLTQWRWFTLSMNHCASGLSAVHLARRLMANNPALPVIVLSGEKSFSPAFNRLPVGLLGEMSTACLLSSQSGHWEIKDSAVRHINRYYKNQDAMTQQERNTLRTVFYDELNRFLSDFSQTNGYGDAVIPYNLNAPLLRRLAQEQGWNNRMDISQLARVGHTWCSDVFYNLSRLKNNAMPKSATLFSAGMGITLSAMHIART